MTAQLPALKHCPFCDGPAEYNGTQVRCAEVNKPRCAVQPSTGFAPAWGDQQKEVSYSAFQWNRDFRADPLHSAMRQAEDLLRVNLPAKALETIQHALAASEAV